MYIYKNNINIYIRVLYSFDLISRQTLLGLAPDQTWFSPVASAANRRQHCEEQACELHQKYRITHTVSGSNGRDTISGILNNIHCAGVEGAGYYIWNIQ